MGCGASCGVSLAPVSWQCSPLCDCSLSIQVVGAIRHKRASGQMDGEYKQLLGKLLRLHPDYYSMWNFRKEAVLEEVRARNTGDGGGKVEQGTSARAGL